MSKEYKIKELREKFYKECTYDSIHTGLKKTTLTPHDLFEWFKRNAKGFL